MVRNAVLANAVIIADEFPVGTLSQLWLARHGVVQEGEFREGSLFSDQIVLVRAVDFALQVLPNRIQLVPRDPNDESLDPCVMRLSAIAEALPHITYKAIGLNFLWHITAGGEAFGEFNRRLFWREGDPLLAQFDTDDARFGVYLSKNALGGRLKLNVQPIQPEEQRSEEAERLQLEFNFHYDQLAEPSAEAVGTVLAKWADARQMALGIMSAMEGS